MLFRLYLSKILPMNDFGLTEKMIESLKNLQALNSENAESVKNFIIAFIVFAIANIATIIVNLFMQFKLKNKDIDIIKFNLREGERIKILFKLYEHLEQLTYYDNTDQAIFLEKTKEINRFITKNKLYIAKNYISVAQEFNDYFLTVLSDYRNKNFTNENRLLDEFTSIFNK